MNEPDQNFEQLKRLLKLKRHEVPPPGYFNNFSGNVITRLRAGEARGRRTLGERLQREIPWLVNFFQVFETRPGLVGGFAVSLCLLLLLGVVFTENSGQAPKSMLAISGDAQPDNSLASLTAPVAAAPTLAAADGSTGIMASTNPATSLQPVATLFGQPSPSPLFQPASFVPGQ